MTGKFVPEAGGVDPAIQAKSSELPETDFIALFISGIAGQS